MHSKVDVVHITTAHASRYNQRIFLKECRTLAKSGRRVALIVADGKGDETIDGVTIYDIGRAKSRLKRLNNALKVAYKKACELNAEIYHLHDPELLPIGGRLKRRRKKVIFDSHEDIPKQQLQRHDLNVPARYVLSSVYAIYEKQVVRKFDAIVTATPAIRDKFQKFHPLTIDISSYPDLNEFSPLIETINNHSNNVCYIGRITTIRGIVEIVDAIGLVKCNARLLLAGIFNEPGLRDKAMQSPGWKRVVELGWLDRNGIINTLQESSAGLVTIYPAPNHMESQPSKLFEYMAYGIPIVASNFPLWKQIVEGNQCGLCVDPLNPLKIAEAIDYILKNESEKERMSRNGIKAAQNKYNWETEGEKLIKLYDSLSE